MAKHVGRGFTTIEYPTGMNQNGDPSQAWVKLKPDGRVDVFAGTVDIGQGSKTVHTQIVADALGVPYDWVTMDNTNTDSSPVCTGSFASRGTFIGGNAVRYAAEQARERVLDIASKELEADIADLDVVDGTVLVKGAPDRSISVSDVAAAATWKYGELITGTGAALKPYAALDPETGAVEIEPHSAISYAACMAEVEVDDETGIVEVLNMYNVYEMGRALNPAMAHQQIVGGAWMGISHALFETTEPYYPDRAHGPTDYSEYLMPGPADLAAMESVILERPAANGPYGGKGIGEMTANSPIPAIANAIYDACGVRVESMPFTPEKILRGLDALRTANA